MWDLSPFKIPQRRDSDQTIKTAQSLGVRIKMVTGDHVAIAKEIARMVGLGTNIESGIGLHRQTRRRGHGYH